MLAFHNFLLLYLSHFIYTIVMYFISNYSNLKKACQLIKLYL